MLKPNRLPLLVFHQNEMGQSRAIDGTGPPISDNALLFCHGVSPCSLGTVLLLIA